MSWLKKIRERSKARAGKSDINWPVSPSQDRPILDRQSYSSDVTLNDVSEYITEMQEALQDTRQRMLRKDYSNPKLGPLVSKLERKVPTLHNLVLPPLIKHAMLKNLNPLIQRARDLGDKYIPKLMEDLDAGILDHVPQYLWLSYLNQMRLAYAKNPIFENLRSYVLEKYNDDISDPAGHTAFVPAKGFGADSIWEKVEYLEEQGLVLVREVVTLKHSGLNETQNLAIITMSDVVGD